MWFVVLRSFSMTTSIPKLTQRSLDPFPLMGLQHTQVALLVTNILRSHRWLEACSVSVIQYLRAFSTRRWRGQRRRRKSSSASSQAVLRVRWTYASCSRHLERRKGSLSVCLSHTGTDLIPYLHSGFLLLWLLPFTPCIQQRYLNLKTRGWNRTQHKLMVSPMYTTIVFVNAVNHPRDLADLGSNQGTGDLLQCVSLVLADRVMFGRLLPSHT